jgi:nucleoside-diphosphate-sugar epimerase
MHAPHDASQLSSPNKPAPIFSLPASGEPIVTRDDLILVTGAGGFVGVSVVDMLLSYGYTRLRCLVRPSTQMRRLLAVLHRHGATVEIMEGNLTSPSLCAEAVKDVSIVYHLAAGVDKSYPGAVLNSVVTTRNLLNALVGLRRFKRFVNVSSFAVYDPEATRRGELLSEAAPLDPDPVRRGEAYAYGKVKQDVLVFHYEKEHKIPVVTMRPGSVFGPGRFGVTGRVGIDTFGIYLHLGGSNRIPLTYVDNCADAIVLAGLVRGAEGQIFNIVDDDLPTSRAFLKGYKKAVGQFPSIPVPYPISYALSILWEKYSRWSEGQLPPVFNRSRAMTEWRGNTYSNQRMKDVLKWTPRVPMSNALRAFFEFQAKAPE